MAAQVELDVRELNEAVARIRAFIDVVHLRAASAATGPFEIGSPVS